MVAFPIGFTSRAIVVIPAREGGGRRVTFLKEKRQVLSLNNLQISLKRPILPRNNRKLNSRFLFQAEAQRSARTISIDGAFRIV